MTWQEADVVLQGVVRATAVWRANSELWTAHVRLQALEIIAGNSRLSILESSRVVRQDLEEGYRRLARCEKNLADAKAAPQPVQAPDGAPFAPAVNFGRAWEIISNDIPPLRTWLSVEYGSLPYRELRILIKEVGGDLPELVRRMHEIEEQRLLAFEQADLAFDRAVYDAIILSHSDPRRAQLWNIRNEAHDQASARARAELHKEAPWDMVMPALLQRMAKAAKQREA
jgi:hypothetical protein